MKTNKLFIILIILALLLTTACTSAPETEQTLTEEDGIFTDFLGRKVEIETVPDKVISLSPALTEILFALDVGHKVVGTTNYCDYPQEALETPKIGDFSNPNYEIIVKNNPDLILLAGGVQANLIEKLESLNLKAISIDAETVEDVLKNITFVGKIMGAEEKALEITEDMEERMSIVQSKVQDLEKPLVFFEVWDEPLTSAGPETYIDDLINLAGGINMTHDAQRSYPSIDFEVVVDRNPDIYIAIMHQRDEEIINRPGYESLKAVQKGRVYNIEDDWVTMAAPRIILGLEEIASLMHPEAFQ